MHRTKYTVQLNLKFFFSRNYYFEKIKKNCLTYFERELLLRLGTPSPGVVDVEARDGVVLNRAVQVEEEVRKVALVACNQAENSKYNPILMDLKRMRSQFVYAKNKRWFPAIIRKMP